MIAQWSGSGMPPLLHAVAMTEAKLKNWRVIRILAVDPGVITGVAVFWFDADTGAMLAWAETMITFDELEQVDDLILLLRALADHGSVHVVIEDFRVAEVNMSSDFLSPVRIGRMFAYAIHLLQRNELGMPVFGKIESCVFQDRSRKADYSNERLKKLGYYTPGKDHRRDATRHGLVRWKQLKKMLPLEVASLDVPPLWDPLPADGSLNRRIGKIKRSFNGKPTGSKVGEVPKKGVTKADMERIKLQNTLPSRKPDASRSSPKRRKLL